MTKLNKKTIRLMESELHRIIKESVKKVLNESQQFPIDPNDLADELFNNGADVSMFVHQLEKRYEMLQSENQYQTNNLYMRLVQAIKNSSSFFSGEDCWSDGKHEYSEGGDASFHGTVNGINLYCIGYYIIKGSNEPGFYGFGTDGDHYYLKNINPTDIPRIIKQIQKEDRNEQK